MGYIDTAKNANLQAALALAKQGIAVFPAGPDKRPMVKGWQDVATADTDQIERWWAQFPNAMPAMPTGKQNGIAVMDVDLKDGKDGAAGLRAIGHDSDLLSPVQSETPTGGRHILFRWPDGMGNSNAGLPEGVDVRGEGGFIIAPGAVNGKGAYRLLSGSLGDALPEWPPALLPRRLSTDPGEAQPTGLPFAIIESALRACPNTADEFPSYEDWLRMGMALHAETGGSPDGLAAFEDWSAQYGDSPCEEKWRSFKSDRLGGVSGWHIINEAERRGWSHPAVTELRAVQWREREADLLSPHWTDAELAEIARAAADDWKAKVAADPLAAALLGAVGSLTFSTPADCEARPTRPYVVKGLIGERDVAAIVGAPGAGKSLLAPYLGFRVAQGEEPFGRRTKPGGVFYVAAEDGHGMAARVRALRSAYGDAEAFQLVEGVTDLLSRDSTDRKELARAVEDRRPSLIIIDTLAIAFPGLEENDAKAMGDVVAVARALTKWGAAVVLIHHDTKQGDGLPRGHSVLNGALDLSLHLKRDGSLVRVRPTKNRNGSTDQELAFSVGTIHLGTDEDGDPIYAAICDEADASDLPSPGKPLPDPSKAALEILEGLARGGRPVTRDEWREACLDSPKVSGAEKRDDRGKAFRRALEELARRDLVTTTQGGFVLTALSRAEAELGESDD